DVLPQRLGLAARQRAYRHGLRRLRAEAAAVATADRPLRRGALHRAEAPAGALLRLSPARRDRSHRLPRCLRAAGLVLGFGLRHARRAPRHFLRASRPPHPPRPADAATLARHAQGHQPAIGRELGRPAARAPRRGGGAACGEPDRGRRSGVDYVSGLEHAQQGFSGEAGGAVTNREKRRERGRRTMWLPRYASRGAPRFLLHYACRRPWTHLVVLLSVLSAVAWTTGRNTASRTWSMCSVRVSRRIGRCGAPSPSCWRWLPATICSGGSPAGWRPMS